MRLSISQKLTVAFLGLTLLVLVATLGLARWSFEYGFLDYVNALEQVRLERVANQLVVDYTEAGRSWAQLTPRRFDSLLRELRPAASMGGPSSGGPPPPVNRRGGPPGNPRPGLGPPPGADRRGPPTALYDADGQLVIGDQLDNAADETIHIPIIIDGARVGELRSAPRRELSSPQETAFSAQQLNTGWLIAAASLLLATAVSLLLARGLLAPVRRMMTNVNTLSGGDYSVRMNRARDDELGELMDDIDRLARTLEESRSSRRRWLADISHELRTPVTILTGELEALRDGVRPFDQDQVDSLAQEVQRLRHLIDDLYELSLSDLGGLRYEFSVVNAHEHLKACADAMRPRAEDAGIEVIVKTVAVRLRADGNRLDQLFKNLFENSLAYTDNPGRMEVSLSRSGNQAIVTIEDTAPGRKRRRLRAAV